MMDSNTLAAIIGVAGTILGTIAGFGLTATQTWIQDRRNRKKQIEAARMMISVELEFNLEQLHSYYKEISQEVSLGNTRNLEPQELASASTKLPLPIWGHNMWESQMQVASIALSLEEIKYVHNFHIQLDNISAIQAEACRRENSREEETLELEKNDIRIFESKPMIARAMYTSLTMFQLGERLKQIIERLLKMGNPLLIETDLRTAQGTLKESKLVPKGLLSS